MVLKINSDFLPIRSLSLKVTVIIPNHQEEDREEDSLKSLLEEQGTSYTVKDLDLYRLIDPVFIEGFVKRGREVVTAEVGRLPNA